MVNVVEWSVYFCHNTVNMVVTLYCNSERVNRSMVMMRIPVCCMLFILWYSRSLKIPHPWHIGGRL